MAGGDTVAIEAENAEKALATASSLINGADEAIDAMLQANNSRVSDLEERLAHVEKELEKLGGKAAVSEGHVAEEDLARANEERERLRGESQSDLDRASERSLEEDRSWIEEYQAQLNMTGPDLFDLLRRPTAEHTDAINALQQALDESKAKVQELQDELKRPKLAIAVLQADRTGYQCYVSDRAVDFRSILEAYAHETNQSPSRLVASSCVDGTTLNDDSVIAPRSVAEIIALAWSMLTLF